MKYRSHRYPTQFPMQVRTAHGLKRCHVVNVSQEGARLSGLDMLKRGEKVQLDVLSHRIDAVVLWAKAGHAGITFRPKLNDNQLDTLLQRRTASGAATRGRVGFSFAEMG
jgi:hypothetical protein